MLKLKPQREESATYLDMHLQAQPDRQGEQRNITGQDERLEHTKHLLYSLQQYY